MKPAKHVLRIIGEQAVLGLLFLGVVGVLSLGGCSPLPLVSADGELPALNTFPQPVCLVFCTAHIAVIREQVAGVGAPVTTGAKSVSSATTNERNP